MGASSSQEVEVVTRADNDAGNTGGRREELIDPERKLGVDQNRQQHVGHMVYSLLVSFYEASFHFSSFSSSGHSLASSSGSSQKQTFSKHYNFSCKDYS